MRYLKYPSHLNTSTPFTDRKIINLFLIYKNKFTFYSKYQ